MLYIDSAPENYCVLDREVDIKSLKFDSIVSAHNQKTKSKKCSVQGYFMPT